jgi:MFS transporter, PHS family, inorganic phosphate transporter
LLILFYNRIWRVVPGQYCLFWTTLRLDGFKARVCWVTASGFFTTSYYIFGGSVIAPTISFVYLPQGDCNSVNRQPFIVDLTTLTGTAVETVTFGLLADVKGCKKLYGMKLTIVIVATIGLTQSSAG